MASEEKNNTFLVSDESVNSHGSWVSTAGIDVTNFLKNPIMLWNHNRTWRGTTDEVLPIGRWENLRVEKGAFLADPIFDMDDEFAAIIGKKVKNGFLKACSVGLRIIEMSDDPKLIKAGQKGWTITKSELVEISICDIPSNKNAVALYDKDGEMLNLSETGDNPLIPILKIESHDDMNLKDTANLLGLADTATQLEINAAIAAKDAELAAKNAELKTFKDAEAVKLTAERDQLLDAAETDKRLSPAQRDNWQKLFDADFDAAKQSLATLSKPVDLKKFTEGGKTEGGEKTYLELSKENPKELLRLKTEEIETFKTLYKTQFGVEYKA